MEWVLPFLAFVFLLHGVVFYLGVKDLIPHFVKLLLDAVNLDTGGVEIHGNLAGIVADADRGHPWQSVEPPLNLFYIVRSVYITERKISTCF